LIIIGISAFYHDSAAAVIKDGEIIAAAQEERFTRKKHDASFPNNALSFCLKQAGLSSLDEVSYITFYEKPFLKFERLIETYLAFAPRGLRSFSKAMPIWLKDKLFQKNLLKKELLKLCNESNVNEKILFTEHHQSHAASAFYPSPFERSLILTMDGTGEWATTSVATGKGNELTIQKEIHFPHSLGLLYSSFTYFAGFKVNSGEYKVMGLAPYGEPKYTNIILDNLIDLKSDGTFKLNMEYFDYCTDLKMTNNKFAELFDSHPRKPETPITQKEMDMAASIQKVTEEIIIKMCRSLVKETGQKNLCLAGGVALNCVANGKIVEENIFENIWIQPAAGDAGGALGAALATWHQYLGNERKVVKSKDSMKGAYLGPSYTEKTTKKYLNKIGSVFQRYDNDTLIEETAKALENGQIVGWFNGRMEFGPRALGARSIIADARSPEMQKKLNLKVKFRESFRPFAPSVLEEYANQWFDLKSISPYMLLVHNVTKKRCIKMSKQNQELFGIEKLNVTRSDIPAVTHVDYSARIQTVSSKTNPQYHKLIKRFYEKTGCPVLANTSFNIRGEPIVCSPEDAYKCFMGTDLDILVIDNFFLKKNNQPFFLKEDYKKEFSLD
jgi:carbamoyltransferase